MDIIEQIIAQLKSSGVNESEADTIGMSLTKFKEQCVAEAKEEAQASVNAQIEEGVKERTIVLEAEHLKSLDEDRSKSKLALEGEMKELVGSLAKRVKVVVENGLQVHGDRLVAIAEAEQADAGKGILDQITEMVTAAQANITESQAADPAEVTALKQQVAVLENEKKELQQSVFREQARGNVAETSLKTLRESLDESLSVVVEDTSAEPTKAPAAQDEHKDSQPAGTVTEDDADSKPPISEDMRHMQKLAGIGVKKPVSSITG